MQAHVVVIEEEGRLDKILSTLLSQSRNQVEKLIREGLVSVGEKIVLKPSYKLAIGCRVSYSFREAIKREEVDIDFDVEVLYEDDDLLVVNKPSGLVVHPAPSVKEPTLVDWLVSRGISLSTISGEERHGIVHRIDKETTGALVVAKNNETHQALSLQLQEKSMGRYYLALIDCPLKENRRVDKPIARNSNNRLKMAVVESGREAKTDFVGLSTGTHDFELISAKLYTGRTHQIRVHLESLGRHILGDELYGFKSKKGKIPRVYLHAYMLYLVHPKSNQPLEIVAPLFDDMGDYMKKYFDKGDIDEKIKPAKLHEHFTSAIYTI